ncbi:glycosyltransferase [bacterium]|nr:glycosyltransferase [bacterium]
MEIYFARALSSFLGRPAFVPVPRFARIIESLYRGLDISTMNAIEKGISFIVPVYNARETVIETLASIVNQNIQRRFQVVVVDDGSTDQSLQCVRDWLNRADYDTGRITIQLATQENGGEAAAMNTGISLAEYPLIAWVESDVTIHREWCNVLLDELENGRVAGAGGILYPAENEPAIARIFGYEITCKIRMNANPVRHITSANAMYKKAVLDEVGPCRVNLGESSFDSDINQRIRDAGYYLHCNPLANAWHRFKTGIVDCLIRAWWYGLRRPYVKSQVLYAMDRYIGILVLLSGLLYPALVGLFWTAYTSLALMGLILTAHLAYSLFLFILFRDPILLVSAPVYLLRNCVFILAYGIGWIVKGLEQKRDKNVS